MERRLRAAAAAAVAVSLGACTDDGSTQASSTSGGGTGLFAGAGGGGSPGPGGAGGTMASGGAGAMIVTGGAGGGIRTPDGGGSPPDASSPSDSGVAPDASSPGTHVSSIFEICGLSPGGVCDGIAAYAACVQTACGSALSQCFGPNNARDDFTGGVCATYAECVTSASDSCHTTCTSSSDCQACLGTLGACLQSSPCTAPHCTGGPGGGPDGGAPVDGGGSPISGTCNDLQACCTAITDTTARDACNATLADSRARGGDADCAIVFSTYRGAGICR